VSIPLKPAKQEANEVKNKRMYQEIWEQIKAAPTGKIIQVKCHKDNAGRIIQAVKKEKTAEVAVKKKIGMLRQGSLIITKSVQEEAVIISFHLNFDGTKL
jgi:hypothetical protein